MHFSGGNVAQQSIRLSAPLDRQALLTLRARDQVLLSGQVLVFRDQVHRNLGELIARGEPLPFDLTNQALYYCGPTPPRHGLPVGAAGPTTSSRMDPFTGPLLEQGLAMTIGKGDRSREVAALHRKFQAVYLVAIGGAGAMMAKHITAAAVIGFEELGPEAAYRFTVKEMPLIVGFDTAGGSAFE
ncbi:FumA C-terminus/TtdB family hydratase beta subunit [Candidatus Latescibacterota bacterium]